MIMVFLAVFVLCLRYGGFSEALGASMIVSLLALIPVGMLMEARANSRIVTEETTSVVKRVENKRVLLEGEVKTRELSSNVILEEGDTITYQLTESGRLVIKKIEIL